MFVHGVLDAVEHRLDFVPDVVAIILGKRSIQIGGHQVEEGLRQLPNKRVLPN
eukprot:SAG22_NODE_14914_length_361_cov_2.072519_1_plen_52_part_10